jgi:hypothetical protein
VAVRTRPFQVYLRFSAARAPSAAQSRDAMRVVHLSASDCLGGAARAAFRLHRGLLALGHDSSMVVARKASDLPSVHEVAQAPTLRDKAWGFIAIEEIHRNLTPLAGSHFSFGRFGTDVANHPRRPCGRRVESALGHGLSIALRTEAFAGAGETDGLDVARPTCVHGWMPLYRGLARGL